VGADGGGRVWGLAFRHVGQGTEKFSKGQKIVTFNSKIY
jgi:hypothetical protein